MDKARRNNIYNYFGVALLFVLGILARTNLSYVSVDMHNYGIPWFDYILSRGILAAMGDNFSNYTPPYTYLVALMTLTSSFLPKVTAIKLISILADFANAFLVYKILHLKYPSGMTPLWAVGTFLCLPTVFINSAIWGQADAIFTIFILVSLYFFLKEKPLWGMLAFSVSFAFKAQAIFLVPFLAVLFFKKQIKVWHFFLVPAVYLTLCLPVILLGRGWVDVLTIYLNQSETYHLLSANAPNFYLFISNEYYQPVLWIGLVTTMIVTGIWVSLTTKSKIKLNRENLILIAQVSVAGLPFLLPKMHDRYFYLADVISILLAFYLPELLFIPISYQAISILVYSIFLFNQKFMPNLVLATGLNLGTVIFLLWRQNRLSKNPPDQDQP